MYTVITVITVITLIKCLIQGDMYMLEFSEEQNNGLLTAKQLSRLSGESYRTIDFYSNQGLLRVSGRRGRIRLYREDETMKRIKNIRKLQDKGYPLTLIKENLEKGQAV